MALGRSGARYAQALFELASQESNYEGWLNELIEVQEVLSNQDFKNLLNHAEVSVEQKHSAVEEAFNDNHQMIKNLVLLLIKNSATDCINDLVENYENLLDIHFGRQRIEVTTAVALDAAQITSMTEVVRQIVHKEVVLDSHVDESIIGGVVIRIGDQLLDGSIKTQLNDMRKAIKSGVI
ncbi:MAG: ATP synthase F1 subunit delta [SAR202 cluster bacterium]|nr:ATP synthase F1 subunit delta [SAR202 cluster bacterium]|tara:strand:- start:3810 stop:4349 length:540 start_codon:yes stop_codon:yes gene_type:complete